MFRWLNKVKPQRLTSTIPAILLLLTTSHFGLLMGSGAWRSSGKTNAELIDNLSNNNIIRSKVVENTLRKIDRKNYVPPVSANDAYLDSPVELMSGQTISAPHMHASCLELLKDHLTPGSKALDVGSGSGYLAAAMGLMVGNKGKVFGIDVVPQLVNMSIENIKRDNPQLIEDGIVNIMVGDGWKGMPDKAPFDCIHVGAAAETIPQALIDQLKPGGRMVIPEGPKRGDQNLVQIDKKPDGSHTKKKI